MNPYLLLLLVPYTVFCQRTIRIPLKKFPIVHSRMSPNSDLSRWKREDNENNKPVFIYDPATYGMIGVGTPMQQIPILFDTHSNVTWLFNNDCTSEICLSTDLFDSSMSNTSKTWSVVQKYVYKNISMYGRCTVDTFLLGDFRLEKLTFIDVRRTEWNNTVDRSSVETYAGEISLRIPALDRDTGMLSHLFSNGAIDEKIFGLKVPSYKKVDMEGELIIGDWDRNFVNESSLDWTPLISDVYWEFLIHHLSYGKWGLVVSDPAVIDTGLSIIVGPINTVKSIFNRIRLTENIIPITIISFMTNYDGYAVRCKSSGLYSIDFRVNERYYVLEPRDYLLPMDDKEGWCAFGIVMANSRIQYHWRLGDVFLSKVYTVFDVNRSRLSFTYYDD